MNLLMPFYDYRVRVFRVGPSIGALMNQEKENGVRVFRHVHSSIDPMILKGVIYRLNGFNFPSVPPPY